MAASFLQEYVKNNPDEIVGGPRPVDATSVLAKSALADTLGNFVNKPIMVDSIKKDKKGNFIKEPD